MSITEQGDKPKLGRPTLYDPVAMPERARKLCLLGLTDSEMAVAFGVAESTFQLWMQKHSEFSGSVKEGRIEADATVAQSLYDKALNGDTTAQIFWLKNRRSKGWRDARDVNQTNEDGPNRTKAVADENRRVRELLERLGSAATPHRAGATEEPTSAEFVSVLCESNRRTGRTS